MGINILYEAVICFGIISLYLVVTLGLGGLLSCFGQDGTGFDPEQTVLNAYILGLLIFLCLSIFCLKSSGQFDGFCIPTSESIVKEVDE